MKRIFLISILILLNSCSPKAKSKSAFKITLGNLAVISSGGAYVNFVDPKNAIFNIIKLDSDNSANITFGTYDLIIIAFEGPEANSGNMSCGSILAANISAAATTFTLNVSASECSLPLYTQTILELKKGIISKWDFDRFDLTHWGP